MTIHEPSATDDTLSGLKAGERLADMLSLDGARIYHCGETAIVLELAAASEALAIIDQSRIWLLAKLLAQQLDGRAGLRDIVPAYKNITIVFDPAIESGDIYLQQLLHCWQLAQQEFTRHDPVIAAPERELPVYYGGEYGPDLQAVADFHNISSDEVIERHCASSYTVAFVGFQPGFAYLLGLDPALHTPRLTRPRTSVPALSVAIGGAQTAIYPASSPGGWHIIGRYCAGHEPLFDPEKERPALLAAGDAVKFVARAR